MEAKLSLKIGANHLKVSGSEKFVLATRDAFEKKYCSGDYNSVVGNQQNGKTDSLPVNSGSLDMHISSYGATFGIGSSSSGSELLKVAAIYLLREKSKERFTRQELRDAMKEADTYSVSKHGRNMGALIKRLKSKGVFIEKNNGMFSLDPDVVRTMSSQLG